MAIDVVSISVQDADGSPPNKRVLLGLPTGKSDVDILAFAQEAQERIDRVTDGKVVECTLTKQLALLPYATVPAANQLKINVVAGSKNEIGGKLLFTTSGPRRESIWVPAFIAAALNGESIVTSNQNVIDFNNYIVTPALYGATTFRPLTMWGYDFLALVSSGRAIRRK